MDENEVIQQQRWQRQRKRHLEINISEIMTFFVIIASASHLLLLTEHAANGLVEGVKVNMENK